MSEPALFAGLRAVYHRLATEADAWTAAYRDRAPVDATMPYVVYFLAGGGEDNELQQQDASLEIIVKVVTDDYQGAAYGMQRISELLNDSGTQCAGDTPVLDAGATWEITTVTQGEFLWMPEYFENVQTIYHGGYDFRLEMELK